MNCPTVTRLLPLHVGGDLAAEKERAVSHHLLSCDECRRVAGEYEESQQLLRTYEPPEFDAAFHEGVWRAVMQEVNNHHAVQLVPVSLVARLFRMPPAYALPAALLFVACTLTFFIYRPQPAFDQAQREKAIDAKSQSVSPSPNVPRNEPLSAAELTGTPQHARAGAVVKSHRIKRTARPLSRTPHQEALAEQSTPPEMTAARNITAARTNDHNVPATVHTEALSHPEDKGIEVADAGPVDAAPEMLRIELQTSDPNIRIIWLAQQN
ncbi:MAG TPA: zf-HC2 domain-containing protein [Pyrinomonadaceae bacterium]|nr:zf-HC2 domain-containing protein [Pyrinomonadaceae bacterium]